MSGGHASIEVVATLLLSVSDLTGTGHLTLYSVQIAQLTAASSMSCAPF